MAGRRRSVLAVTGARGELAQALRQLRDQRGMTLRQVAARSGYSPATLSMAESGRRFPSFEVLAAFVQSCGADPAEWRPLWQSAARAEAEDEASAAEPEPAAPGGPGSGADAGHAPGAPPWPGIRRRLLRFTESKATAVSAVCAAIVAAAVWATVSQLTGPPARTPGQRPRTSPAAAHPAAAAHYIVAPESCGLLLFRADGAADPVTCPDGRPNLAADRYYRPGHFRVLSLGPAATQQQIQAAACADLATGHTSFPIEARVVDLAQAEQDWHFGAGPANIGPDICPPAPRRGS